MALETGVSKWGVLTACLKEDKDKFRGCVCNNLFQETVQCSKALHGHFIMDFQELTAVEYLGRVAASKKLSNHHGPSGKQFGHALSTGLRQSDQRKKGGKGSKAGLCFATTGYGMYSIQKL